jgi:NAD(P)-dependent dehydrogenase (short-subunit alcohol dehydrogenase family)
MQFCYEQRDRKPVYRSSQLRRQFETNFFGVMDVTSATLPHLRASPSACLVIIGSRSAWKTEIIVRELYFDQGAAYFVF